MTHFVQIQLPHHIITFAERNDMNIGSIYPQVPYKQRIQSSRSVCLPPAIYLHRSKSMKQEEMKAYSMLVYTSIHQNCNIQDYHISCVLCKERRNFTNEKSMDLLVAVTWNQNSALVFCGCGLFIRYREKAIFYLRAETCRLINRFMCQMEQIHINLKK